MKSADRVGHFTAVTRSRTSTGLSIVLLLSKHPSALLFGAAVAAAVHVFGKRNSCTVVLPGGAVCLGGSIRTWLQTFILVSNPAHGRSETDVQLLEYTKTFGS